MKQKAFNEIDWQLLAGELSNYNLDIKNVELFNNREINQAYD